MGLTLQSAKFLMGELKRGVKFKKTLTLGHQGVYMSQFEYEKILSSLDMEKSEIIYADDFFKALGASQLDVMDTSNYEGATIIKDLNNTFSDPIIERYDCVIDGGTLEHVFNFPQAIKTCMDLVNVNGHLILLTPWNNYAGHGFYQFSPELFYRTLSLENGYRIEKMLINKKGVWYSIHDPNLVNSRVEIQNGGQTLLYISARRIEIKSIFSKWPQQSDYSKAWAATLSNSAINSSKIKERIVEKVATLQKIQKYWRKFKEYKKYMINKRSWFFKTKDEYGVPL